MNKTEMKKIANGIESAIKTGLGAALGANDALVLYLSDHNLIGFEMDDDADFAAILNVKWPGESGRKRRSHVKGIAMVAEYHSDMKSHALALVDNPWIKKAYPGQSPAQIYNKLVTHVKKHKGLGSVKFCADKLTKGGTKEPSVSSTPSFGNDPVAHLLHLTGKLRTHKKLVWKGLDALEAAINDLSYVEKGKAGEAEAPVDMKAALDKLGLPGGVVAALVDQYDKDK